MSPVHVVIPFSRPENLAALNKNLAHADRVFYLAYPNQIPTGSKFGAQTKFYTVPERHVTIPCWHKLNWFIHSGLIDRSARYLLLCDDDALPDGFADRIRNYDEDLVVVGARRGYRTLPRGPYNSHPYTTLWPRPKNMTPGRVTLQQLCPTGDLLRRQILLETNVMADGVLAESLARRASSVRYEPSLHVEFNRLEPGRWDRAHRISSLPRRIVGHVKSRWM